MAKVRVEWITLGVSPGFESRAANILKAVYGSAVLLDVGDTATAAEERPVSPNGDFGTYTRPYARVSVIEGRVIVVSGADPTAAQDNGVLVIEGSVELIPCDPGRKLSFIELDLS